MNDFQYMVLDQAGRVDKYIMKADRNNERLRHDVEGIEVQLEDLEKKIKREGVIPVPGEKIQVLLRKWRNEQEDTYDIHELLEYAGELWLSRKQFEEQLVREARGYEMIHRKQMAN